MTNTYEPASSTPSDATLSEAADNVQAAKSAATDAVSKAADTLSQGISAATEQLTAAVDRIVQSRDEWMAVGRERVRASPLAAVTVAFFAGVIFSRLTRD